MKRLRGFDYKRPFFYMVTLKRLPQNAELYQRCHEMGDVVAAGLW